MSESIKPQRSEGFPYPIPGDFDAQHLTQERIAKLEKSGWTRIGAVPIILDPQGNVIEITHNQSGKFEAGAKGIISETSRFYKKGGKVIVEQIPETIYRALFEEAGISQDEIASLNFSVKKEAWGLAPFPLGGGKYILGVIVVMQADEASTQILRKRLSHLGDIKYSELEVREGAFVEFDALHGAAKEAADTQSGAYRLGTDVLLDVAAKIIHSPIPFTEKFTPKKPEVPEGSEKISMVEVSHTL